MPGYEKIWTRLGSRMRLSDLTFHWMLISKRGIEAKRKEYWKKVFFLREHFASLCYLTSPQMEAPDCVGIIYGSTLIYTHCILFSTLSYLIYGDTMRAYNLWGYFVIYTLFSILHSTLPYVIWGHYENIYDLWVYLYTWYFTFFRSYTMCLIIFWGTLMSTCIVSFTILCCMLYTI